MNPNGAAGAMMPRLEKCSFPIPRRSTNTTITSIKLAHPPSNNSRCRGDCSTFQPRKKAVVKPVSIRIGYLPLALIAVAYGVLFSLAAYGYTYYGCIHRDPFSEVLCIITRTAVIALVVLWPAWAVILSRYSGDDIGRFVVPLGLS